MRAYAEYLKSMGATDEDVKVLDTPVARRAYEAVEAEREKAQKLADDTKDWFDNVQTPEWNTLNADLIKARTEAARFQGALRAAEDRGLLKLTDLGLELTTPAGTPPAGTPPAGTPPGFDPTKYVTLEQVKQIANQEGAAIAMAQDIAAEHAVLFPGQRLNFTSLREEALQARKPVMQHWMDKYKVADARAAQVKAAQEAHDKKVADDAVKAAREQWSRDNGSNPDLRTPVSSSSPFTIRKTGDDLRAKQPWESPSEGTLSNDRVRRAVERQAQRESGRLPN